MSTKIGNFYTDIATMQKLPVMAVLAENLAAIVPSLSHPLNLTGSGVRICW